MNILPVIVSCKKNSDTWKSIIHLNKNAIIFYGDPNMEENYYFDENTRILKLKCNDFYEGLPEKMIALINAVLEITCFKDITHIIKIDDYDVINKIVNMDQLKTTVNPKNQYMGKRVIRETRQNEDRKWHFGKCSKGSHWQTKEYKGKYTTWADGGKGYILSIAAMKIINSVYNFTNINDIKKYHIYEDLMIALILNKFNIKPVQF